ncbi:MAG: methionine--tRNA ligase [Mycoplasmoidaceae bacterium]
MNKFYITTPIYYSSGKPHIGHAYSTVMADVLSRYKKILDYDVFFLTGMDEHGQKIENKAAELNIDPREFVDDNHFLFKKLWKKLDIDFNYFIRTSNLGHQKYVQKIFDILFAKDYLYKDNWTTWYCVSCEENIRKSDIVEENNIKKCSFGHELIKKQEESYFLKVTIFKDWLINFYQKNEDFIFPKNRVNELINNFLNYEFEDLSVTRTNVNWGIKLLNDQKHTIYVWIDALLNYLSSLSINHVNDKFWNRECEKVHLLSKEITRFHCIYWPILLKMLDFELPNKIISHGWIITNNNDNNQLLKMSKSLNNVIDPHSIINEYDSDSLRYFLMKQINVISDSTFDMQVFKNVYNADLANNFGNIISRTIGLLKKYNDGYIPKYQKFETPIHIEFENKCKNWIQKFKLKINSLNVNEITFSLDKLANYINSFIEECKPWIYFKENKQKELNEFLVVLYNAVLTYAYCFQPILVNKGKKALEFLKCSSSQSHIDNLFNYELNSNDKLNYSEILFMRK